VYNDFIKFFRFGSYDWLGEYRANAIKSLCHSTLKTSPNYSYEQQQTLEQLNLQIPLDIFHSCYLLNTTLDQQDQFLQQLTEPIIQDKELRQLTIADDLVSRFFSVKYVLAILEELQKQQQEAQDSGDSDKQQAIQQILQQLQGQGKGEQGQNQQMQQVLQEVTAKAKKQAKEETEKAKLYSGLKAGVGHDVTFGELLNLDFVVDIKQLLKLFREFDFSFTKTKKSSIYGIYDDIKFGNDLTKIMSQSLALPEELFWYYYATEQLPLVDTEVEEISEYTLVVDKSGSMKSNRNKTLWSRAVALVLAKQAKKHRVKAKLMFFDDQPFEVIDLGRDFNKALDYILKLECDGGTSIDGALKKADNEGIGTIILVTDGEDNVYYKPVRKLVSVMVEGNNEELRKISDDYLKVKLTKEGVLQLFQSSH